MLVLFALGILCIISFVLASVWVLLWSTDIVDSSGDDFSSWVQCLVQQWIHVLRQYSGGFGRIYTVSA